MKKESAHVTSIKPQPMGVHVFYTTKDLTCYIENAVSYIVSGIEQGDQIFFVENDRIYPMILKKVEKLLTKQQLENIHFLNNFTFYWQNGNFHPPTILAYFSDIVTPFIEKGVSFRTWGHIEWGDEQEITRDIEEFEKGIEQKMPETKAISVCAYDDVRLTESLRTLLIDCHHFLMTDDTISTIKR